MLEFAYAYGEPEYAADFRSKLEDFIVVENLGFELSGEGEHLCVQLEKRNENTQWVAENIARQAGVKPLDVSYCGKKDRFAITTQWFSVYLPKAELSPAQVSELGSLNPDGTLATTKLVQYDRHNKKLRRGEHQANSFQICLRNISSQGRVDIDRRLENIRTNGVPNYFGEQRFGHGGNNLTLFNDSFVVGKNKLRRKQKSLAISAARSQLFNLVLAARVKEGSWLEMDTGPMWGRGELPQNLADVDYEKQVLASWSEWCDALEHVGLYQERRQLVLKPQSMGWQWQPEEEALQTLHIEFTLPSGEFATSVLREIVRLTTVKRVT